MDAQLQRLWRALWIWWMRHVLHRAVYNVPTSLHLR